MASALIDPHPVQPPGMENLTTIINWLSWGVSILGIVGVLIVAGMMMMQNRRGEGGEAASRLGWVLCGVILAAAAGPVVSAIT